MGKTELVMNNLNPDFKTTIGFDYHFERRQELKFEIIDDDGKGAFDLIGSVETLM